MNLLFQRYNKCMTKFLDNNVIKNQYKSAQPLDIRRIIHEKYSTNKLGFHPWLMNHYCLYEGDVVLELGCGSASLWKNQEAKIKSLCELVLTDASEEMVASAENKYSHLPNVSYRVMDAQNISFPDQTVDVIIVNMVFQHIFDLDKCLREIKRVLKPDGRLYCSTYGEEGIMYYLGQWLKSCGFVNLDNHNFTMQNGQKKLQDFFNNIQTLWYDDSLAITDVEVLLSYLDSVRGMAFEINIDRDKLRGLLISKMDNGVLTIPKQYGMFIATNT